ncbi:MAG: hypothetical protein HC929_16115 [Leptolyngbyaceae cyanobacterium SM2_5_2]|nr:hypothetical protein [Leptolyngbyaceae cyanobacterium SM2_5_2]
MKHHHHHRRRAGRGPSGSSDFNPGDRFSPMSNSQQRAIPIAPVAPRSRPDERTQRYTRARSGQSRLNIC